MKKYLVGVLAICMLFVLSGCGKKENKNKQDSIVGKWTISEIQNGPVTITFNEDKTVEYKNANFTATGTYEIKEDNIIIITDIWNDEGEFEYIIKDDTLTLDAVYVGVLSYPNMKRVK